MFKSFLFKTIFLIIAMAVVLSIIFVIKPAPGQGMQTNTFFQQFVLSGGPIVWFVLLPMSMVMVFLVCQYCLTIRRGKLLPQGTSEFIIEQLKEVGPEGLEAELAEEDDFVSIAIVEAVAKGKGDFFRMRSTLAESLQEQALKLLRSIEWLNLVGNVSPMVGLFGTVFGMIKLFNAIVIAGGQPQPAQLAGGISVALVTTFWGLFIAIPALAIHGVFRNRIETLISEAVVEAETIMPQIRLSIRKQQQTKVQSQRQTIKELAPKVKPATIKPEVVQNLDTERV